MNPTKEEYLKAVATEVHAPAKKKFKRLTVRAAFKDQIWSMDLVEMAEWAASNDGYKYLLNAVDVFTRYAFSQPLKTKTAAETFAAFQKILKTSGRTPHKIWVDQGAEFYNAKFEKWATDNDVAIYSTYGDSKSVIVERFNKTLKHNMWFYFTSNNTRRWVDILPTLIDAYNAKKHSKLRMSPEDASLEKNKAKVFLVNNPISDDKGPKRVPKFEIGDIVRISRKKGTFEKGFHPNFSQEMFEVIEIDVPDSSKEPITYRLRDQHEEIEGSFYEPELVKVKYPDIFLVEKTLKKRKVKGKTEYFVKWLGLSEKENSWVSEDNFTHEF